MRLVPRLSILVLCGLITLLSSAFQETRAELTVHTNFSGGSGEVLELSRTRQFIHLRPTQYQDRGWACWWYVRISGLNPNLPLSLQVGDTSWATPDRATYSLDGQTWAQSPQGIRRGNQVLYTLNTGRESLWVAWGPPFVPQDAERLARDLVYKPGARPFVLCRTREGRPTPAVRFSTSDRPQLPAIWVQARQHAWEAGSSWIAKGLMEWMVSDEPGARFLRDHAETTVIPIMDIDNVHRGAGGKNQLPQDHNRDWSGSPHWRAVAEAQRQIRKLDEEGRLEVFIDLHNPGPTCLFPYYYVPPKYLLSSHGRENLDAFIQHSQKQMVGPLRFLGRSMESGANYDPEAWKEISKNWVAMNCQDHVVSVTLETAWNTPSSTTEGYQILGRQLGQALASYMADRVEGAE